MHMGGGGHSLIRTVQSQSVGEASIVREGHHTKVGRMSVRERNSETDVSAEG
jgi:hypothetical protein